MLSSPSAFPMLPYFGKLMTIIILINFKHDKTHLSFYPLIDWIWQWSGGIGKRLRGDDVAWLKVLKHFQNLILFYPAIMAFHETKFLWYKLSNGSSIIPSLYPMVDVHTLFQNSQLGIGRKDAGTTASYI